VINDEVKQILRDLADTTGATEAEIIESSTEADPDRPSRSIALGGGRTLRVTFSAHTHRDLDHIGGDLERAVRALRGCARRWQVTALPLLRFSPGHSSSHEQVIARIEIYLQALENSLGMDNAVLLNHGSVVTTASPLSEEHEQRIPFTMRLAKAESKKQHGTSHAHLSGADYVAATFHYDAVIIGFFSGEFAEDFVRHRIKQVCRELVHLLELLDEPPKDPVQASPIPEP
jgi:hypothetical protein